MIMGVKLGVAWGGAEGYEFGPAISNATNGVSFIRVRHFAFDVRVGR